ncbi:flagellar hook capping FlgD N-terminal domain-containing protein [Terracidiphilus sp.]|jgi:flagellar basal-body rod modification protein FlgD|uniref:flagellar hook capping FlgD N-terminal domain-containing protein n=1 Tax=Terracidiphilus sp. TaxID=1964191 RepID=UPI003C2243DF
MSATSGILNPVTAPQANPLMSAQAMDTSTSSSSSSDTTISANDFLTLLVTEMQNQDPTSDTDPNEYIDQLVNVNSLEQLININQTLTTAFPSASADASASLASGSSTASAQTSTESTKAASAHANSTSTLAAITPPPNGPHSGVSFDPTRPTGHPLPVRTGGPITFTPPTGHPLPVRPGGPVKFTQGNLGASSTSSKSRAALRVARSLDGQRITR